MFSPVVHFFIPCSQIGVITILLTVSDIHNHFTNSGLALLDFVTVSYHAALIHTCNCKSLYFLLFQGLLCYI